MQPVKKGYWVEMVRCSERIGSSGDNDSSGGGERIGNCQPERFI